MKKVLFTLFILFSVSLLQAQPKPDTSKMVCTVTLPQTVTSETVFTLKADCKVNAFSLEVYSLSGQVMFKTEDMDEFELGKKFKALKSGQYNYVVDFSYFRGGRLNKLSSPGQIYIVK